MNSRKQLLAVMLIAFVFLGGCISINFSNPEKDLIEINNPWNLFEIQEKNEMPKYDSCNAIKASFLETQTKYNRGLLDVMPMIGIADNSVSSAENTSSTKASTNYSETNIQVEGVDEADIVKTDGEYIYVITGNKLVISKAFPAEEASVLFSQELENIQPQEMFIHKNSLILFGTTYEKFESKPIPMNGRNYNPGYYNINLTKVQLWDISNKINPQLKKTIEVEGSYLSSRKIGNYAYFVSKSYPKYWMLDDYVGGGIVPVYRETAGVKKAEFEPVVSCTMIGKITPYPTGFMTIASINLENFDEKITKKVFTASAENVFASLKNIFIAETNYNRQPGLFEPINSKIMSNQTKSNETTIIHKFALKNGNINFTAKGEVPGRILNQFSMDEFENNFRIATTEGRITRSGGETSNNIYVLNNEMEPIGSLEDLAPGESIYSARFMGNKAYLVTFRKVDPLFVIDLSNPTNPKVKGKLKIPGYSDYLHPIDETHLIGLGKEAIGSETGDFGWYQGIKLAVFDVSNVEKPIEMFKIEIGDRGTDSYALHEHKAFLYDKEKQLLVLPILLAEIKEEQFPEGIEDWQRGDYVFQGAYVYNLNLQDGFNLRGTITHIDDSESFLKSGYYYGGSGNSVKRTLFIEDNLYTISDNKIKINSLKDLTEINELIINENKDKYYGIIEEPMPI